MEQALPYETLKLADCARSLGVTSNEFRALCGAHGVPVLRPSERRERLLREHFEILCRSIAQPPTGTRTISLSDNSKEKR